MIVIAKNYTLTVWEKVGIEVRTSSPRMALSQLKAYAERRIKRGARRADIVNNSDDVVWTKG